jgi:hypothetical protein
MKTLFVGFRIFPLKYDCNFAEINLFKIKLNLTKRWCWIGSTQLSLSQPALTRPGACDFTRDLMFTPPLCNYYRSPSTWGLQFSSASQPGASTRKCVKKLRFSLEKEPSFKEFLVSAAVCFRF